MEDDPILTQVEIDDDIRECAHREMQRFDMVKSVASAMISKYGCQTMKPELIATESVRFADAVLDEMYRTEEESTDGR